MIPKAPGCWGCEMQIPVVDGYHVESTDIPFTFYYYPCTSVPPPAKSNASEVVLSRDAGQLQGGLER